MTYRLLVTKHLAHIEKATTNGRDRPPRIGDLRTAIKPVALDLQLDLGLVAGVPEFDRAPATYHLPMSLDLKAMAVFALPVERLADRNHLVLQDKQLGASHIREGLAVARGNHLAMALAYV